MRYVSPFEDQNLMQELMHDLSGLVVGSSFLTFSDDEKTRIIQMCDNAAHKLYNDHIESNTPAIVQSVTLSFDKPVGFDSLVRISDLAEDAVLTQLYRYFDTPREAIVLAAVATPQEMKRTHEFTFFSGPDRRKTGDYRIFSLHPGPKRHIFPNRYQPEHVRKENRDYWDRHAFLTSPSQMLYARDTMRSRVKDMEDEAKVRVFHMTKAIDGALHRWYGTWENYTPANVLLGQKEGLQEMGDFAKTPDMSTVYYMSKPGQPPPDFSNTEETESRLSNEKRPARVSIDGVEEYFLNGKRHRNDGPAIYRILPDGGWEEIWYEDGLISRLPDKGPAHIVYSVTGEIEEEKSIYKGSAIEETTLGPAAEPVKALQSKITDVLLGFKWFEDLQDFQLLRSQLDLAAARNSLPIASIVRQMQQQDEQVGLRWDFDRTLEQDKHCYENYHKIVVSIAELGVLLLEASRAMRFVKGEPSLVAAIWGKILKDLDRVIERGQRIPGEPGKTIIDDFEQTQREAKKFYQTLSEQNQIFSATGQEKKHT